MEVPVESSDSLDGVLDRARADERAGRRRDAYEAFMVVADRLRARQALNAELGRHDALMLHSALRGLAAFEIEVARDLGAAARTLEEERQLWARIEGQNLSANQVLYHARLLERASSVELARGHATAAIDFAQQAVACFAPYADDPGLTGLVTSPRADLLVTLSTALYQSGEPIASLAPLHDAVACATDELERASQPGVPRLLQHAAVVALFLSRTFAHQAASGNEGALGWKLADTANRLYAHPAADDAQRYFAVLDMAVAVSLFNEIGDQAATNPNTVKLGPNDGGDG